MRKSEAISIFGRTQSDLARALGITKSAVSQWPDELDQEKTDRVLGAALRLGVDMTTAFIGHDTQLRCSNDNHD
jgi:transcriptional regulator with XRE-family HTH domain